VIILPRQSLIKNDKKVQDRINNLFTDGESFNSIAKKLKEEGIDISKSAVKRYIDDVKDIKGSILSADSKLTNLVRERIFDTTEELREVIGILHDLMKDAQTTKRFKITVIKEIRETIKLADGMMRDLKSLNINQGPQSKIELIQIVVGQLNELEEKGDIRILNPALKTKGNHQQEESAEFTEQQTEEEQK
jgi:hypothetical protein